MIHIDTSKDRTAKAIIKWCKENEYDYSFETKDKERNIETYPFNISAPSDRKTDLDRSIGQGNAL